MSIFSFGTLPSLDLVQDGKDNKREYADLKFAGGQGEMTESTSRRCIEGHIHAEYSDFSDLWSALLAMSESGECPVIMFNSPEDSCLSAKLVRQVARLFSLSGGKEILVVDGNLRRPLVHERFELPNGAGLSCYLNGAREIEDVIVKTRFARVDLIRAGNKVNDVVSLLMSQRCPDLIAVARERYDLILINSMAYGDCVDAFVIAKFLRPVLAFHGTPEGREAVAEAEEDMAVLGCHSMKYIR